MDEELDIESLAGAGDFLPNSEPIDEEALKGDMYALFDQEKISESRRNAEERFKDIGSSQVEYLKKKMKHDLFFLGTVLGYENLSPNLHGSLAGWLQKNRSYQHKLILLPRGHYKSTICTVVDSVQMALPVDCQEYPHSLGPNGKYLVSHEVRETASKFLFEITRSFTHKDVIVAFFPDLIPKKNEQRLNKWELELPREKHHKEATFSTGSSGGAEQGAHYNWLKLDDLIGKEARESPTVMQKVLDLFDNINSLLTEFAVDGWDLIGTRWAYADVYSHAMERYGISTEGSVMNCLSARDIEKYGSDGNGLLKVYARGAIENSQPIFPEQFSLAHLQVLRKNRLVWAAQYANNPVESGLNEFVWKQKFYNVDMTGNIVVFTGEGSFKRNPRKDLDICVLVDPSMGEKKDSDETGICVTGVDTKGNIFILETVKQRLRPPEFVNEIYRLHYKYRPRVIAIEKVNFSGIYKYWIEKEAEKTNLYLPLRDYIPGSKQSKEARIRGLAHFFSSGQIYFAENMHDIRDEYEQFPLGKSQHLLDALAQGPTFWVNGVSQADVDSQTKAVEELVDERSIWSGY